MPRDELIDLEHRGWEALASTGHAVADFYQRVLEGSPEYSALISSSYVRRGNKWKLTLQQQTPR